MNSSELKDRLTPMEWYVTQESGTEPPFSGKYYKNDHPGLYVDVTDGTPLFLSTDKFASTCGWPAFAEPLPEAVRYLQDTSHGMVRTEVRSAKSNAHLGHVFNDGPASRGGLRYCINSAALRFIPEQDMEKEGYGKYLPLLKKAEEKLSS